MKKKKLKKKIKKLERDIKRIAGFQRELAVRTNDNTNRIKSCKEVICILQASLTKLENDNKYYKEWMDRSGVDYKSWFNFDEKTCDTCKWKPLMEQGGQDIPCMGCTANDKKMWKSKD